MNGLQGSGTLEGVDAGAGAPADFTPDKVGGKIALVGLTTADGLLDPNQLTRAERAGAKAVLAYRPAPGYWTPDYGFAVSNLPAYTLPQSEGEALKAAISAAGGSLPISYVGTSGRPYVYNPSFPQSTPLTDAKQHVVHDKKLGRIDTTYASMGVATSFIDYTETKDSIGQTVGVSSIESVGVPGTTTEFYTPGKPWLHFVTSSFPWGDSMMGTWKTLGEGERATDSFYAGVVGPTAMRDEDGNLLLTAERQGNLMGFAPTMWGDDADHSGINGSFGDLGNLQFSRNGELIGESPWTSGVFEVPDELGHYELTMTQFKFSTPAAVWKRSAMVQTTWGFDSQIEPTVYSRPLPLFFPRVSLPGEGGLKTMPAGAMTLPLRVTGHLGYDPEGLSAAVAKVSYDGGGTWSDATVTGSGNAWTISVDHTGKVGQKVSPQLNLTDGHGATVNQTVIDAYAIS